MQKLPKKGIVTLAFDDAYLATYKQAIKHLDRLKIKSTIAVPVTFIGKRFENRQIVGLKDLKKIIKSGHDIASHTLTHQNLLRLAPLDTRVFPRRCLTGQASKDKKAVVKEVSESKKELESSLNHKIKIDSFVFPYINRNQSKTLRSNTKRYYKSARITQNSPCFNKIPIKDPYRIKGLAIMKKHSLSYLNKQVDFAQKNNLWLVEVFHLVSDKNTLSAHRPKPYRFFMHIDNFKRHIDYILAKKMLILTQKDAVRHLRGPAKGGSSEVE